MEKTINIVTHSGSFHSDDVFSVATLLLVIKSKARIIRSRDPNQWQIADFIVDVGGEYDSAANKFDHHQIGGAGQRENSIPYASFGLVWKKFGTTLCGSDDVAEDIDRRLVQQIDALDNGVDIIDVKYANMFPYLVGNVIFSFLPSWNEDTGEDDKFEEAVSFAKDLLVREVRKTKDREEGKKFVIEAYNNSSDKRIVVLDREYPWGEVISRYSEPLVVVYPSKESWHAKCVRDDTGSFVTRISFPEPWAGKTESDLAKVSGVSDAVFCHTKRFLAVSKTKDGAVRLAQIAIGNM